MFRSGACHTDLHLRGGDTEHVAAGAARGISHNFSTLALTSLMTGFAQWSIPMNIHKTCGIWFPREKLGMANGVVSVGMALGFLLGSLMAAIEVKGVGNRYAGSATGLIMTMMGLSNALSPPTGNWLAQFGSGYPFFFWAALVISGATGIVFQQFSASGSS